MTRKFHVLKHILKVLLTTGNIKMLFVTFFYSYFVEEDKYSIYFHRSDIIRLNMLKGFATLSFGRVYERFEVNLYR